MSERKPEEEYFAKLEAEKKARLAEKLQEEHAAAEAQKLREMHWHKCGKCGHDMASRAFRGFEIEVCTSCGAVLLDPGELEALAGEDHTGTLSSLLSLFGRRA